MNTTAVTWPSTAQQQYASADYKNYCSDILCSDTTSWANQRVKTDFHFRCVQRCNYRESKARCANDRLKD